MEPSGPPTRELTLEEAVSFAILLQRNEHFVEAHEVYRRVLEMAPDHPRALHYAGVLAHQQGRNEEALVLIERSVALVPDQPVLERVCNQATIMEQPAATAQPPSNEVVRTIEMFLPKRGQPIASDPWCR
jgi:hypothetical protein